jgi:hypothetical protein
MHCRHSIAGNVMEIKEGKNTRKNKNEFLLSFNFPVIS